jgi:AraC family transcriptional regulator, arabinose operon regulatory protein
MIRQKIYFTDSHNVKENIYVKGVGLKEQMPESTIQRPHGLEYYQIMFFYQKGNINEGNINLTTDQPGVIIWAPGTRHYYGNPNQTWEHSWVLVSGEAIEHMLGLNNIMKDKYYSSISEHSIEYCIKALYREISNRPEPDPVIVANNLNSFFRETAREIKGNDQLHKRPTFLNRIISHLQTNYIKKWTLDELSQYGKVSKPHLCASMQKYMSCSVMDYITKLRINEAKILLADQNLSITSISQKLGYESLYYFSRQFKKCTGLSPTHYISNIGKST